MSHLIYEDLCTCRGDDGEPQRMGNYINLLYDFQEQNPGVNIVEFFKKYNITKMCCRRTLMTPYSSIIKIDDRKHYFMVNLASNRNIIPDLEYLDILPNLNIDAKLD